MIITVTSWRGIGTTTTALLLAASLAEREPCWLVEADPAGGVLAGRVHLGTRSLGALEHIAFPSDHLVGADAFDAFAHHRGALRIVAAPADPFKAHACHSPRLPWTQVLHELDGVVVVDAGRLRAGATPWPLLALADGIVLVTSPEVCAAVGTTEWLLSSGRVAPNEPGLDDAQVRVAAVDQPGGIAFDRAALSAELGERWGAWLPWEPETVDVIHRGATWSDRRLRRSRLVAAVDELSRSVREPVGVQ
jgi:hypothetical protein